MDAIGFICLFVWVLMRGRGVYAPALIFFFVGLNVLYYEIRK